MDQRPKCVRCKTRHFFKENIEQSFHGIGFGSAFFDKTSKAQVTKQKIHKLEFMKILRISAKTHYQQSKNATQEWEKIFVNHISDKVLLLFSC